MPKTKVTSMEVEFHDRISPEEGFKAIVSALGTKEITTKAEILEDGVLEWDISKDAPGYRVVMRDEGAGKPRKIVVGKAKRVRKAPTLA